jgi:hypothetical protein
MAVQFFPVRTMGSTCSTRDCNMETIPNMAVHAFPIRTMVSTCSTRDCITGNNIKHGGPIFSSQNNGSTLFQSEQRVQSFPVRTMGSSCSSRDCTMGNNIKMANHALFAEQLDPLAQPGIAIRGTISEMAVQSFSVRSMGSKCST